MYVVALIDNAVAPDAIAADLGIVAYEARQRLALGSPAVIWTGKERDQALSILAKVRARDPLAIACDTSAVVASAAMISMRDFAFTEDALTASGQSLMWSDVLCILRATQQKITETTVTEKQSNFSMGRALVSGGLVMSKSTSKEVTTQATEKEQVLYLFRRSGQTPWILREASTRYGALGAQVAPVTAQNFLTTTKMIRERAPRSVYDERLVTMRVTDMIKHAGGLDLLAHLLALAIAKR